MNLFVYGTLMDAEIMHAVSGLRCSGTDAVLHGYVRKTLAGEVYPAIRPGHALVDGLVYTGLTDGALARLDRFEGSIYARLDVRVDTGGGARLDAQTYVMHAGYEHLLSDEDWSYREFVALHRDLFRRRFGGYRAIE